MSTTAILDANKPLEVGEQHPLAPPLGMPSSGKPMRSSDDDDTLIHWIRGELTAADPQIEAFRDQGRTASRFVAGDQLDPETRRMLRIQKRPDSAFNATQKYVSYVAGLERRAPQTLMFEPAVVDNQQQQALAEFMTQTYEWVMKHCSGHFERSRAFYDMIVTGIGCTDVFLDTTRDPAGMIRMVRVSPFDVLWPDCDVENLRTTRWRAHEQLIDKDEALRRWPKHRLLIEAHTSQKDQRELPVKDFVKYTIPYIETEPIDKSRTMPSKKGKVCVTDFQWWEDEEGYSFTDPPTGDLTFLPTAEFQMYKRRLQIGHPNVAVMPRETTRRVVRVVHLLNRQHMLDKPSRLPGDRFTINFMTGRWDEDLRQWYGFARMLIDPQRYANKFFNQVIEVMSVSAKGGAMAEVDAFDNDAQRRDFEDTFSMPGSVNLVGSGALKEGKIKPKEPPAVPAGALTMLQWCISSLEAVTGISPAALGLSAGDGDGNTMPAMTMRQRQQAGMVLLAGEFDSLSRYRLEDEGPVIGSFLSLIADGRLIRVGGPLGQMVIPLLRKPFTLDYELTLDDTEHDPSQRQHYTNFIMQIGPMLARQGLFVPSMFDYLPFPVRVRREIIGSMQAQQQRQEQAAAMGINLKGRGQPKDPREVQAKIQKIQSETMLTRARAATELSKSRREDARQILEQIDTRERNQLERSRQELERRKAVASTYAQLANIAARGNGNA